MRGATRGGRYRENKPLWVDDAIWTRQATIGMNQEDVLPLTLRVRDSAGRSYLWMGQISVSLIKDGWDPFQTAAGGLFTDENKRWARVSSRQGAQAGLLRNSGKRYFEVLMNDSSVGGAVDVGFAVEAFNGMAEVGGSTVTPGWSVLTDGRGYHNGGTFTYGASLTPGSILMVAVDFAAGRAWFGRNGTWFGGGNPGAGTAAGFTDVSGAVAPAISASAAASATLRMASGAQTYLPPAGFMPWL